MKDKNKIIVNPYQSPCGVLLLDVVLGYGSHEDPAGELAAAIAKGKAATANPPICIASVCGTDQDPQHLDEQCAKLEAQGVVLCQSNAQAAALAACAALCAVLTVMIEST